MALKLPIQKQFGHIKQPYSLDVADFLNGFLYTFAAYILRHKMEQNTRLYMCERDNNGATEQRFGCDYEISAHKCISSETT